MAHRKNERIVTGLLAMGAGDNLYAALYRRVAASFGMSVCTMWIFYYLLAEEDGMTQCRLCEQLSFPKQTVNSAVAKLIEEDYVRLDPVEGSGKLKNVCLTAAGRELGLQTVDKLLQAEIRATEKFGDKQMNAYIRIRNEYLALLQDEFERDFLKEQDK